MPPMQRVRPQGRRGDARPARAATRRGAASAPIALACALAAWALTAWLSGAACARQSGEPGTSGAPRAPAVAVESTGRRAIDPAPARPAQAAPADAGTQPWVLHVGDSFTEAHFRQNLAPRFGAAGARYVVDAVMSTHTTTWADDPGFDRWLALRPALVLVTLGANEFDLPFPGQRARSIETIARKIAAAGASCVWITPPMWRPETGILRVIYEHCAPCVYFDSDAVLGGGLSRAEREPDGVHPSPRGGARWAEVFWAWLMDHRDPSSGPWAVVPFERRLERAPDILSAATPSAPPEQARGGSRRAAEDTEQ
jgi:hypothetical protein